MPVKHRVVLFFFFFNFTVLQSKDNEKCYVVPETSVKIIDTAIDLLKIKSNIMTLFVISSQSEIANCQYITSYHWLLIASQLMLANRHSD